MSLMINTAVVTHMRNSPDKRIVTAQAAGDRKNPTNAAKSEFANQSTPELTSKLNQLAKRRPFSIVYRVKKYDPL